MACELNDITAALNIYVIKGCHQLGTEPNCGCFSPVFLFLGFIFRKWAGLSSYIRGTQDTNHLPYGRRLLRPGRGWGLEVCTYSCFLEKLPTPLQVEPRDLERPLAKSAPNLRLGQWQRSRLPHGKSSGATEGVGSPLRQLKWYPVYQDIFCSILTLKSLAYPSHCTDGKTKARWLGSQADSGMQSPSPGSSLPVM